LGGETCASIGLLGGELACSAACQYDTLGCDIQNFPFTRDFTQFVAATDEDCSEWNDFRSEIRDDHARVAIYGSNDLVGRTCDGDEARQICDALRDGVAFSILCDGHTWYVGNCGGIELTADDSACSCQDPGFSVRPCINHQDWGGVNSATCGGPTQTITVECGY
jgi:hypothetical protein